MQYWCTVSRALTDEESTRQRAETLIAAETPANIGGMMALSTASSAGGSAAISQPNLDEILRSTQSPDAPGGEGRLKTML